MKTTPLVVLCMAIAEMTFPVPSHATAFCNMDNVANGAAPKAKTLSLDGTVSLLQAAAHTFDMYSQVELLRAQRGGSFARASELANVSIRDLGTAAHDFGEAAKTAEPGLNTVNQKLAQLRSQDYSQILIQVRVSPNSPAAKPLIPTSFTHPRTAEELLTACQQTANALLSERSPTGEVYREVQRNVLPSNVDLWSAMALWTETLERGRFVSAIFAHAASR